MKRQFGILTAFFTSLCAFCAYVVLALFLCTLTSCSSPEDAAVPGFPDQGPPEIVDSVNCAC